MSVQPGLEAECSLTLLVSPLVAVLAMAIGCSIMSDSGHDDYQPLFLACRMGALGGPIAAVFCILITSTFVIDDVPTAEPMEIIAIRRKLNRIRTVWGVITPYVIGIMGGPIGSAILRAAKLADTIRPISAVRAAAVGGIFAMPVYYLSMYFLWCLLKPCFSVDDEMTEPAIIPVSEVV